MCVCFIHWQRKLNYVYSLVSVWLYIYIYISVFVCACVCAYFAMLSLFVCLFLASHCMNCMFVCVFGEMVFMSQPHASFHKQMIPPNWETGMSTFPLFSPHHFTVKMLFRFPFIIGIYAFRILDTYRYDCEYFFIAISFIFWFCWGHLFFLVLSSAITFSSSQLNKISNNAMHIHWLWI